MTRRQLQPTTASPAGGVTRYGDRIFDDQSHDPYQSNDKYKEPTRGAVKQHASVSGGEAKYLVDQE